MNQAAHPASPSPRVRRARQWGFAAWAGLVLLHLAWHTAWHPPSTMPIGWALGLALVPLLLPLLALRRPARALLLAGMVSLFYFCHGVSEAWTTPAVRAPALIEVVLSLTLVGSLGAAVERRRRR